MFDFTSQQLADKVREVAQDYPDNVYKAEHDDSCVYFNIGQDGYYSASCIVGHALHRLGVKLEDIEEFNNGTVNELFEVYMPRVNRDTATDKWLTTVQDYQDFQMPWGQCVKKADSVLRKD